MKKKSVRIRRGLFVITYEEYQYLEYPFRQPSNKNLVDS